MDLLNESGLAEFVNAMPLPAAIIGPDERIVTTNQGFDQIMGAGFAGRHYINVLRQPALIDAIAQVVANGGTANATYLTRSNGADAAYDLHVGQAGRAVLITLTDRTDAENAGRMRTDFIANVSHELRTPLTALMGFIETLRGAARDDPAARDRFLGIMEQEAGRMTGLVDGLMTLSRLEENERRRPTDQVKLGDVLTVVSQALMPIARAAEVDLMIDVPDQPVTVLGDAAQLQQVFTNLIENAIKYGAQGNRVLVTVAPHSLIARLRAQGTTITVQDFGDGIAPHHITRLTERFYRVDSHRSRQVGGTGLGLAIVKHIINRHRGRLAVTSELGAGTIVTVTLPKD
ncbi:MAG: two-component system phosphate regulon sensor histidine kinase PhoR [Yoonia sp.]|jgi:two-component system phosphate regulon sensor histidine kinase PhoR